MDGCLLSQFQNGPSKEASLWEDTAFGNRSDSSSTNEEVCGIATLESLQGEEVLVTLAVWRLHKIPQVCGSTAMAEARSMAKAEDHISAISYMLAEDLKLGRPGKDSDTVVSKKRDSMVTDSKNCYDFLPKRCAIFSMKEKLVSTDLKEYPQRCVIKGQTLQRKDNECFGDYLGNWVRFFDYPKEVRVSSEGLRMSTETKEMLSLLKDVLAPKIEEVHWPLRAAEVRSRLVKFNS